MPEWLYEEGIGENRAILLQEEETVEAVIELPGALRPGTVAAGRLTAILIPGRRGIVDTNFGAALVEPLPSTLTEGQKLHVEILRAPLVERGDRKLAKARVTEAEERKGPTLRERIGGVTELPLIGPDRLEQAGWSELLEEATSGVIPFPGGELRMSLTPAMTLFDVDGALPLPQLAVAGAAAGGRAIRRFGIGGSIGIDLPTLASKRERQRAADALDAVLPQPFERTAVNGFGFLQVVRRRERASLPELVQFDPVGASARALLRKAERHTGAGERQLIASPEVIARIRAEPMWIAELERRIGGGVRLREDAAFTTWASHVQAAHHP